MTTKPISRPAAIHKIKSEFVLLATTVQALVSLPTGVEFNTDHSTLIDALSIGGCVIFGTEIGGTDFNAGPPVKSNSLYNPTLIRISVRHFYPELQIESPKRRGKPIVMRRGETQHRAIVWVDQGPGHSFLAKSLVDESLRHPKACTIEELAKKVADCINDALTRAKPVDLAWQCHTLRGVAVSA